MGTSNAITDANVNTNLHSIGIIKIESAHPNGDATCEVTYRIRGIPLDQVINTRENTAIYGWPSSGVDLFTVM